MEILYCEGKEGNLEQPLFDMMWILQGKESKNKLRSSDPRPMLLTIIPLPLSLLLAVYLIVSINTLLVVIIGSNLLRTYRVPSVLYTLPITLTMSLQEGSYSVLSDTKLRLVNLSNFQNHIPWKLQNCRTEMQIQV